MGEADDISRNADVPCCERQLLPPIDGVIASYKRNTTIIIAQVRISQALAEVSMELTLLSG